MAMPNMNSLMMAQLMKDMQVCSSPDFDLCPNNRSRKLTLCLRLNRLKKLIYFESQDPEMMREAQVCSATMIVIYKQYLRVVS
jgi:hypothetical protein